VFKELGPMDLFVAFCIVVGCAEQPAKTIPAPGELDDTEIHFLTVSNAETELRTLKLGTVLDPVRAPLLRTRIEYLTNLIRDPSQGSWIDDNSTREKCLVLEAQLTALVKGRAMAGSAEQLSERTARLQSLLNQAGYEFDERGFEQEWDEHGNRRAGYTPLLAE
jgi:hypothetical protein